MGIGKRLCDETTYDAIWWQTSELPFQSRERNKIGGNVNCKVVESYRFSTKRHLVHINTKSRTLKMHICLFAFSEIVTSQGMNKRRKGVENGITSPTNQSQPKQTSAVVILFSLCR
ncbi:hypothetical protein AVEN_22081-1 [Araneus ventricosus]|uniref:Uncharacterized protein n=1 Tax=Araneus ventricosus TaxID=182803 RepID=A0A4Y2T5C3_ARAVE|nr:hypothetical protein AVEN_22081-1 [Araneus ventricosus]